ncbi:MAG: DNA translocase FtsK [Candidatus Hydrogenedentes bacterium]|nr:DNA translocase FtsK [Candidatus Hydrogenedentota bacterium]
MANVHRERHREIAGVVMLALTTFLFLALVTDGYQGDIRRPLDGVSEVPNALGRPGAAVAGFLLFVVGQGAHVLYFLTGAWGVMLMRHAQFDRAFARILGLVLHCSAVAGLLQIHYYHSGDGKLAGGAIGDFVANPIYPSFGIVGSNVIALTIATIGMLLATDFLFLKWFVFLHATALLLVRSILRMHRLFSNYWVRTPPRTGDSDSTGWDVPFEAPDREPVQKPHALVRPSASEPDGRTIRIRPNPDSEQYPTGTPFGEIPVIDIGPKPVPTDASAPSSPSAEPDKQLELPATDETTPPIVPLAPKRARKPVSVAARRKKIQAEELPPDYEYPKQYQKPTLDLLELPPRVKTGDIGDTLRRTSAQLEETLQTFGIEARVTDITRGPTITRFELEPAPGIKVSRFLALADDVALALKALRVRVEAPIPGKGRVGIEVPNVDREPVVLRELLDSSAFRKSSAKLPLALGKDIAGDVAVTDLENMPHLLVAGATGAGKTVCVKSLLASLLFTKVPEELQLMLIDPKMVELSVFNDIPHLITPVVTDPKKAATALNWLIVEMEERYRLFAHLRVRNIEVYNESVDNGEIEVVDPEATSAEAVNAIRKLPYIICIIDELADLMMLARAEVEDAIARLAQLARAVGIHLIIATQRPSVDVLTGVIKANFPARVSFQVSSRVDSRCILDEIGAERLVGKGDMLYLPAGQSKPTRIQGAFVHDDEMSALVSYLKTQAPPQYRDEIERFGKTPEELEEALEADDELFDEAVRVVLETGQASISMVQRRLRVGYTRAARLIDMMELRGIVGPHSGSKAREILVDAPRKEEVA